MPRAATSPGLPCVVSYCFKEDFKMDIFCKECSSKPGWPWDAEKIIMHSCQRCFRTLACNDYSWRKPQVVQSPAPTPKQLVKDQINSQSEVNLPKLPGHREAPVVPPKVDTRTETDMALDAVQPNRPGVKLKTVKTGPPAVNTVTPKIVSKFDVADEGKGQ